MKRIVYNKLVRDRIPQIIEADGKVCETRVLSDTEYIVALKAKLHEEINEYEESGATEELADVLEVIRALAVVGGISPDQLEAIRASKAEKRGGFEKRIYLISVDGTD